MNTLTYSNDPKLQKALLKEIVNHRKLDQIVQGSYGHQNGKWSGCAIACSLRSLDIVRGRDKGHYSKR